MAKLSKRELAVKSKKKAAMQAVSSAPKTPTPRKLVAPLVGEGPLLPGQVRVGSEVTGAGPLLPGQTRKQDSYLGGGTTREQAAKAKSNKNSITYNDLTKSFKSGGLTLDNAPKTPTLSGPTTLQQGGGGSIFDTLKNKAKGAFFDIAGGMGDMARNGSLRAPRSAYTPDEVRANNRNMAVDNTFGIPTTNASNIPDFPTAVSDNGVTFFNNADPNRTSIFTSDFATPGTNFNRPGSEDVYNSGRNPQDIAEQTKNIFRIPTANASGDEFSGAFSPRNEQRNDGGNNESYDNGAYSVPGVESSLADILSQGNVGPADTPLADNPGATVKNRSGRGNGAFGTGKGVMADDPYIKELRKAYASNGGEKWLRKQFEELIAALDPTYAQLQKEGTDALNAQLNAQNNQLASVMNAGNVGDSEQRAQLMAQQQAQTQTSLGNLLAKLAQQKSQDISGYNSQMNSALAQNAERQQANKQRLLEQIQQYRNQQAAGATRGATAPTMKSSKISRNDIFNWVEDALGKGYSWQEIADNAKEQGIGTETGGYLDQLLNQANKQKRYR